MGHDKLGNYYKTNFGLMQHHHWSLTEVESMLPWERYIYIDLLREFLAQEEERIKLLEQERKAQIAQIQRQAKRR
jgi:hypothetical protein